MNVIFAIRPDFLEKKGGDTFQMQKTKEYLEKIYDIKIIIICSPEEMNSDMKIDLMHIFNIQTIELTKKFVKRAKELDIPIVLSPIYWDLTFSKYVSAYYSIFKTDRFLCIFKPFKKVLKNFLNPFHYMSKKYIKEFNLILNDVDILLPNSNEEAEIMQRQFSSEFKFIAIPNCVEFNGDIYDEKVPYNSYILEVGRIEPIKNQLKVIKALYRYPEIPIVFIGKKNYSHFKYIKSIERISKKRGNVFIIDEIGQDELQKYYKKAAVHVLPSYRESPGLVSLEALVNGTNIVVSSKEFCPIEYYLFDKYANVCNPFNTKSIRNEILNAYMKKNKFESSQRKDYLSFFSYRNAANLTMKAYKEVLRKD